MGTVSGTKSEDFFDKSNSKIEANVHDSSWMGFLDALGWMESNNKYSAINSAGYTGRYQFGQEQLDYMHFLDGVGKELFGLTTKSALLNNPIAQELAGIMEFSGIPDVNGSFVSKYTAVRSYAIHHGIDSSQFNSLIGKIFTINFLDTQGNVIHADTIMLTQAGISAAAHLVGQGTVGKAMVAIYKDGDSIINLPASGYADGNNIAFSTYIKLLQNYDISSLINASGTFSTFNALAEDWLAYQQDDILAYIENNNLDTKMIMSQEYKDTISSILKGLDLPSYGLEKIDGNVIIVSGSTSFSTGKNDLIIGLSKIDTLQGGKGFDTYIAGDGDTIIDTDQGVGGGEVHFEGTHLTRGVKVCANGDDASDAGTYEGNGGIYVWSEDHTLTFTKKLADETIQKLTIKDWDNGDLGIHLEKQCEPSPEHVPCPSPTNPLVFPYLPLPSKPSYSSGGGSSGGGSSGAGGYYGGISGGGSGDYHKSLYHEPECYISPVHSSAGAGGGGGSTGPIVLDLNHNGITSLSIAASSALFDYDGDGLRENTAWIESGDALLVSDLNSDGIINDASELFGNYTKLSNGSYAKSGYQALSEYDTNGDGVIDTNDGGYGELKLWIDSNGDGITDAGELVSLADAGVSSVTLSDEQFVPTLEAGNTIVQETSFTDANGEGVARDILFRYENYKEVA